MAGVRQRHDTEIVGLTVSWHPDANKLGHPRTRTTEPTGSKTTRNWRRINNNVNKSNPITCVNVRGARHTKEPKCVWSWNKLEKYGGMKFGT